jgi:hypothetical protein
MLGSWASAAEIRDLGTFGATCPAPVPAASPGAARRVRLDPARAQVDVPPEPSMPVATAPRTAALPVRWPPGGVAVVRTLPAGTPVFVLPSEGGLPLDALRQACPGCRIEHAGSSSARRLGVRVVPAVIRVVDGVPRLTEGAP